MIPRKCHNITKTRLFKYVENSISKNWKFSDKKTPIFFHISAQNIDCGYSLEPPRRGGSNEYPQSMFLSKNNVYTCKSQFYNITRQLHDNGSSLRLYEGADLNLSSGGLMPAVRAYRGLTCGFR